MSWTSVGSVNVGPQDREVLVGSFTMQADDDTIWFRVTQTSPDQKWNYSFGLITWKTSFGQELGTQKVFGDRDSEVFTLGVGLPPLERTGSVLFTPRAFNRSWIATSDPPRWSLDIEAQSGRMNSGGIPAFGTRATLVTLTDPDDVRQSFRITGDFAYINRL